MARAYVGVGSNLSPEENVLAAMRALDRRVHVVATSTFYRTHPLGSPSAPHFVNGVVALETVLPPEALKWSVLRRIEAELGRRRSADRNAPRPIDLDLVFYDGVVSHTPQLRLPDPELATRAFLAWPLLELEPTLTLPDGRRLKDVASQLPLTSLVALPELTAQLRAEVHDEPAERRTPGEGAPRRAR